MPDAKGHPLSEILVLQFLHFYDKARKPPTPSSGAMWNKMRQWEWKRLWKEKVLCYSLLLFFFLIYHLDLSGQLK